METQFLYNPPGMGLYCHSASLLQTGEGDMLASWYAYPEEEHIGASLILARRRYGQAHWGPSEPVLNAINNSTGNPVLFQTPGGTIWLLFVILKGTYWNDAELQGSCSEDGGATWSSPAALWLTRGMMVRHPPILLDNGSLLLPAYDECANESVLLSSQSPFSSWREAYRFSGLPLIQPVLVREGNSRLTLFFRPSSDPRRTWRSHSKDDGNTWAAPVRTPLPNPLSGIAAFAAGEKLAVVYNHTEKHQRHPLSIAFSDDHGISWGRPWHIDTIEFEVSYPQFLSNGNGRVNGVYTYNRRMIKFVSFSIDEMKGVR